MSLMPVSYCANVHPGNSIEEVCAGIRQFSAHVRERVGRPMAVGLWMTDRALAEIEADRGLIHKLSGELEAGGLSCHTMNCFPLINFHAPQVKEEVYRPDWQKPARLDYTLRCANLLAELLPEKQVGSLSTVPLGFKGDFPMGPDRPPSFDAFFPFLTQFARNLAQLRDHTGRTIQLAIEPEPLCLLETTDEAIRFFDQLRSSVSGRDLDAVTEHLGLCYDVCHQAVEFESITQSIDALEQAGVRIVKVHITCALELENPDDAQARQFLGQHAEPRYLHQTFAKTSAGTILKWTDLTAEFAASPPSEWRETESWRIHFHVPVNADRFGPLRTTRAELAEALGRVAKLPYVPHLEVETYTWNVLSGLAAGQKPDLVEGLAAEMNSTHQLLAESRFPGY